MALLIYKQWHRNSNFPTTPANNANNIQYIGQRVHVLKDEDKENGLFGKINGVFSNDFKIADVKKYVYDLSMKGITMFRSVISFTPERSEMLDFGQNKKHWENYVKYHVYTLAKANGIDLKSFEYVAAVHNKKGQPHVHIDFWDKNQKVGINFIDPAKCDEIRDKIETDTFGELAEDMLIEEETDAAFITDNSDEARRALIARTFSNERTALHEIQNELFSNLKVSGMEALKNTANCAKLSDDFEKLADAVPKRGQLAYGYMSSNIKIQVNKFAAQLMEEFPVMQEIYDEYLSVKREEAEMFNSTESKIGKYNIATAVGKAKDALDKKIGNLILKEVKQFNFEKNVTNKESANHRHTANTVFLSLKLLTDILRQAHEQVDTAKKNYGRVDLSKDAKLELIYKNRDKGQEH